MGGSLF